jgi:outer membrane beta-barrel protein
MRIILILLLCMQPFPSWSADDLDLTGLFEEDKQTEEIYKDQGTSKKVEEGKELKEVADLGQLVPFNDIAVLQKRFMPKTERFEANYALSTIMNDPFFISVALNLRLAYYFTERYGMELTTFFMGTTEREVTSSLRTKRQIKTASLITPTAFYGVDFKWVPAYGKYSLLGSNIIPFDLYFSFGVGLTATNKGKQEPTLHLGTGQQFAMSKAMAFRWDFSWNFFSAAPDGGAATAFDNLFLTVGMSYFFPEATYR